MTGKLIPAMSVAVLTLFAIPGGHSVSAAPGLSDGQDSGRCAQLPGKQIAGATIDKAEYVAAGATLPPFSDKLTASFCRVYARISPERGSEIKIQMFLPGQWNGKLLGVGGGGFEGGYASVPLSLRAPMAQGYAGVATNAGHDPSPDPTWAVGNPQKIADYGHRANHLGAIVAKALVADYYGAPAKRAYFHGCSNGGRDALMLAQRYPRDYDAIAVGAPANDFTGLMSSFGRAAYSTQVQKLEIPAAKLKLVHDAVVRKCDALDGVTDGLIERPAACRFDPAVLQCKPGGQPGAACLSQAELGSIRQVYRGTYTRNGRQVVPGLPLGSEYEWANWLTMPKGGGPTMGPQFYANLVYGEPKWDVSGFDLDREYAAGRKRVGPMIDAVDPDLRPFFRNGGKLLVYHGWDDAAIPAGNTLNYYAAMKRASGAAAQRNARLFMMPGVAHCSGGNGPSYVDYVAELDRWSATGTAPERLIASQPESPFRAMGGLSTPSKRTRPLCAWPKSAHYKGTGSTDAAENLVCR